MTAGPRLHLVATCYRAHDPRWSFLPLSGEGAAIRGARFNPRRVPALYLALSIMGAIREATQGLARRLDPLLLCAYQVDCTDLADLASEAGRTALADAGLLPDAEMLRAPWALDLAEGRRPASWDVHDRLTAAGYAGALVPSFAPGAAADDRNLVLWHWGEEKPHSVCVIDPDQRLPKNTRSWT